MKVRSVIELFTLLMWKARLPARRIRLEFQAFLSINGPSTACQSDNSSIHDFSLFIRIPSSFR